MKREAEPFLEHCRQLGAGGMQISLGVLDSEMTRLLRKRAEDPPGFPKALTVSALEDAGLAEAWSEIETLADRRQTEGHWSRRRAAQARHWFEEEVRLGLLARLSDDPATRRLLQRMATEVETGQRMPSAAAEDVLVRLLPTR